MLSGGYPYPYGLQPARCDACPLSAGYVPLDVDCPAHWDWPGYCGHARAELARRPSTWRWRPKIVERAGQAPPAKADPPGPMAERLPPPMPVDGRARVGFLTPCCYLGGADLWIADMLRSLDRSRLRPEGVAIRGGNGIPIVPEVRASWAEHCPVGVGLDAVRDLARRCDVLVAWGAFQSWGFTADEAAPLIGRTPLIHVSHGSQADCLVPHGGRLAGTVAAAVSRAAVRGLPEQFRPGARVIPNMIDPARVRLSRPVSATRHMLGIPPGVKVAGWLGRMASEKRPEVFVDAVAALPPEWIGVMAGIGYAEADVRRRAETVAPGRVIFLGARHDVGDVLATFHVMSMPSSSEAASLAAGESWLAGVPLVSTPVGLLEEHPHLARLIPQPPTGEDLAAAILADAADPEGTARRVAVARAFAAAEMSPEAFARSWSDLICEVAGPVAKSRRETPGVKESLAVLRLVRACPHRVAPACGCAQVPAKCMRPDQAGKAVWLPECRACIAGRSPAESSPSC